MVQCKACFSHQGELITAFALFDNLYLLQDAQNANDFIFVNFDAMALICFQTKDYFSKYSVY